MSFNFTFLFVRYRSRSPNFFLKKTIPQQGSSQNPSLSPLPMRNPEYYCHFFTLSPIYREAFFSLIFQIPSPLTPPVFETSFSFFAPCLRRDLNSHPLAPYRWGLVPLTGWATTPGTISPQLMRWIFVLFWGHLTHPKGSPFGFFSSFLVTKTGFSRQRHKINQTIRRSKFDEIDSTS